MKGLLKIVAVSLLAACAVAAPAENLLSGSGFSKEAGWYFWVEKPILDAGGSGEMQGGKALVKSPAFEKQAPSNIQLIKPLDIEADKSYQLKFKADAEKAGRLAVSYCLRKEPYTSYASAIIALEPGEKSYECTLAVRKDKNGDYDAPRSLRLFFGAFADSSVSISGISFEEAK